MTTLTPNEQAAVAAGESVAGSLALVLAPLPAAAITAAMALLNTVLTKGNGMTQDDFNAAVAADDAAVASDAAARAAATAAGRV